MGLNLTKSEDEAGQGEEAHEDEDEGDEDTKETYAAKTLMISGVPPAYCTKDVRMEEHSSTLAPRIYDTRIMVSKGT